MWSSSASARRGRRRRYAAEAGADVLVLERTGGPGGAAALAEGIVYLGGGTPIQEACGFPDSVEDMHRYLMAACGPDPDEAKISRYCDSSLGHFDWLVARGVPFDPTFCAETSMAPSGTEGLVYSGGEDAHPFDQIRTPGAARAPGQDETVHGLAAHGDPRGCRHGGGARVSPIPAPTGWWSRTAAWSGCRRSASARRCRSAPAGVSCSRRAASSSTTTCFAATAPLWCAGRSRWARRATTGVAFAWPRPSVLRCATCTPGRCRCRSRHRGR